MKKTATRNRVLTGIVALGVGLLLATDLQAQPGFRGLDGPGGPRAALPGLRDLDLSDTQRDTIRTIMEQNREGGNAMTEELRAARVALNEAVMDESFNESAIRSRAAELAALEEEAAVQRGYVTSQIWQVLTTEQRAALRERQAETRDELETRRRGRRGPRQ